MNTQDHIDPARLAIIDKLMIDAYRPRDAEDQLADDGIVLCEWIEQP